MTTTKANPTGRILLRNVRLAFPSLFEPTTVAGEGSPSYSACFLLPTDHAQMAEIKAKLQAVAKEKWGAKAPEIYKGIEKSDKLALHDGDTKSNYDGFAGMMFVNARARESARPTVVDANKSPLTERDGKPYAGCYVNASIEFWAQDNGYGKRINAQLRGVQFAGDGDSFGGGRAAAADEFDDVSEGLEAPDFA